MAEQVTAILFACIVVLATLWRYYQDRIDRCPSCPHCERETLERARHQREMQHDAMHKGFGWSDGEPDRYDCPDQQCPRNHREQ